MSIARLVSEVLWNLLDAARNSTQYTDMTKLLVTLNKMSKGRDAIFTKDGVMQSV